VRREYLDRTLFWNQSDLERKLENYKVYYNQHRCHSGLGWPELRPLNGAAYPHRQSQNLSHIPGGNIAKAHSRPQLPPELEFDTDRIAGEVRVGDRGEDTVLFMANVNKLDLAVAPESVDHRIQRVSDDTVAAFDAGLRRHLPHDIRNTSFHRLNSYSQRFVWKMAVSLLNLGKRADSNEHLTLSFRRLHSFRRPDFHSVFTSARQVSGNSLGTRINVKVVRDA
jgi:hypothetical protein